jgi:glycine/D-amino acid oxidase-like deaminating enzyme
MAAKPALTRKRDLRTGTSYWQSRRMPRVPVARLARDIKTDVLVIGAGISGALGAEALSRGHGVAVVDRRGAVKGSTPASTALVEYEIDVPLTLLARKIGKVDAARAWRRSHLAIHSLFARTRALDIRCDMERRGTLYLAGNVLDAKGLQDERDARLAAGLETAFLGRNALAERFGIKRAGALITSGDFITDPRRMTAGYLNAAAANGAKIYAPVEVTDIETTRSGATAATKAGPTITVKHVVLATGYEVAKIVPPCGHQIISTYAIATKPQPDKLWPEETLIWEASDPYLYMRTTADGRIICGGEDEEFSDDKKRDALIPKKAAAIARKLQRLFPQIDPTPEYGWAGAFGTTTTGLPHIGPIPRRKNCRAVLGFGGNGITYARIAADIISGAFSGRDDPDADLYAFR